MNRRTGQLAGLLIVLPSRGAPRTQQWCTLRPAPLSGCTDSSWAAPAKQCISVHCITFLHRCQVRGTEAMYYAKHDGGYTSVSLQLSDTSCSRLADPVAASQCVSAADNRLGCLPRAAGTSYSGCGSASCRRAARYWSAPALWARKQRQTASSSSEKPAAGRLYNAVGACSLQQKWPASSMRPCRHEPA